MARKGGKGLRLTQRAWAPFGHAMDATGETVKEVGSVAGNLVRRSLQSVKTLGNIWTKHTNMAIRNVTRRKRRGSRKGTRKGSRRH
jgi:hypothetical protein